MPLPAGEAIDAVMHPGGYQTLADRRMICAAAICGSRGRQQDVANIIYFRRQLMLTACLASLAWPILAHADPLTFKVALSGAEEVPPVQTTGAGTAEFGF